MGCGSEPEPSEDPLPILAPDVSQAALSCDGRYDRPSALDEGLARHGWDASTLESFTIRWGVGDAHVARWISAHERRGPSVRTHVLRAPDVGQCVQDELAAGLATERPLHGALTALTPWTHDESDLSGLVVDQIGEPAALDEGGNHLFRALLAARLDGDPPASGFDRAQVLEAASAWPDETQAPLARLVQALGESALLVDAAFAEADASALDRVPVELAKEGTASQWLANMHPRGRTLLTDLQTVAPEVDRSALNGAGLVVARAVDDVQAALADVEPFEGGDLQVATEGGWIVLRSGDDAAPLPEGAVALVVDLGGDDVYDTPVATASRTHPVSVLVDVRGNDTYDPGQPDLQAEGASARDVFDPDHGFTQGSAVTGVAVLSDGAGDDVYRSSVYSQGAAILGIGVLDDRGGSDTYLLGAQGQGTGMFGVGLLRDAGAGDDDYRGYTNIQGVGKPGGVGLLLDEGGSDLYAALHEVQEPWLPEETSADNLLGLPSEFPYGVDGTPHFMSIAQGTGWGFRHEWVQPVTGNQEVWGGGFGALVDLGDGDDIHRADCFSMGQGFVYGMGMLYDGGGNDEYRTFWWGPGASAHMGVGLFWDEDGDDDLYTTRASAGFGYDLGVGWIIDEGGDDTYGGQMHYGRGYLNAHTVFVNVGGDDHYNEGLVRGNAWFGVVRQTDGGTTNTPLLGAFLDLGGGRDVYETNVEGPANGATWDHAPIGPQANPEMHKGIGHDDG